MRFSGKRVEPRSCTALLVGGAIALCCQNRMLGSPALTVRQLFLGLLLILHRAHISARPLKLRLTQTDDFELESQCPGGRLEDVLAM